MLFVLIDGSSKGAALRSHHRPAADGKTHLKPTANDLPSPSFPPRVTRPMLSPRQPSPIVFLCYGPSALAKPHPPELTSLESILTNPPCRNSFKMNTYEKEGGPALMHGLGATRKLSSCFPITAVFAMVCCDSLDGGLQLQFKPASSYLQRALPSPDFLR